MLFAVVESNNIKPFFKNIGWAIWVVIIVFFGYKSHRYSYEAKDSKTFFTNVVTESPHCSIGWGNMAMLYLKEKNYTAGEAALKKALETNPENPEFYTTLAKLYFSENAPEKGNEILEKLNNSPYIDDFTKALKLGQVCIELKNLSPAETFTLKAKAIKPEDKTVQQMLLMIEQMKSKQ
jgi:tetratricopeptide (TPR) repeat protein